LVGPPEETLFQTVRPEHDNRLAVREAIYRATALVQASAIGLQALAVLAVAQARVIVLQAEVRETERAEAGQIA
jgi:hypothetical protein